MWLQLHAQSKKHFRHRSETYTNSSKLTLLEHRPCSSLLFFDRAENLFFGFDTFVLFPALHYTVCAPPATLLVNLFCRWLKSVFLMTFRHATSLHEPSPVIISICSLSSFHIWTHINIKHAHKNNILFLNMYVPPYRVYKNRLSLKISVLWNKSPVDSRKFAKNHAKESDFREFLRKSSQKLNVTRFLEGMHVPRLRIQ